MRRAVLVGIVAVLLGSAGAAEAACFFNCEKEKSSGTRLGPNEGIYVPQPNRVTPGPDPKPLREPRMPDPYSRPYR